MYIDKSPYYRRGEFVVKIAVLFTLSFSFLIGNAQPTITSFSPLTGPIGTTVTITGTHFSTDPSGNIVYFGATRAQVSAATATSLLVVVPAGASYQPLSVTVNTLIGYSVIPFVTTYPGGQPFFSNPDEAATQNGFEPEIDSTIGLHPNGAAVADFDGDGKPDIATANNFSTAGQLASVSIMRNTTSGIGAISFAPRNDIPTGVLTYAIAAGDLDGDGKPDLVSCSVSAQTISVFKNTSSVGSITFAPKIDYPSGTDPFSIAIADIDQDGKPDIIVANYLDGTVSVFRNTSSGGTISFAAKVDFAVDPGAQSVAAGDLDGDSKVDIIVANVLSNTVSILRNTSTAGSVSFASKIDIATEAGPNSVALGDLDGDGKLDFVEVNNGANNFSSYRNTSSPGIISFAAKVDFTCGLSPTGITLSDLNGDGKPDVVVAGYDESVTQNGSTPGNISYYAQIFISPRFSSFIFSIADLDGDGKNDLVGPAYTYDVVALSRNKDNEPTIASFSPLNATAGTTVTILGHDFTGVTGVVFGGVPASSFTVVGADTIIAVVGTGASGSVGVSNQYGTNRMAGLVFHGPPVINSFVPANAGAGDTIRISGLYFTGATAVSFGGMAAASFQVNSDSSITAVIDSGSTGAVQVTTPYGTLALPGFTYYHIPVIAAFSPFGGGTGTAVNINGSYFSNISAVTIGGVPVTSYTVNSPTNISAVAGVGAFGSIAVTGPGGTGLSDTTFAFPSPEVTGIFPDSAAVGSSVTLTGSNFRADPSADIVYFGAAKAVVTAASTTSLTVTVPPGVTYNPVSVTANNGFASMSSPFVATFPPGAASITDSSFLFKAAFGANYGQTILVDLDGDGKTDVISYDGDVSVLKNISTINNLAFTREADLVEGTGGALTNFVMAVGDLNNDGKPDIVVTDNGTFSIFLNTSSPGSISFAPRVDYLASNAINGITIADFDGDGRQDLAMTIASSVSTGVGISIYLNTGKDGGVAFSQPPFLLPGNGTPFIWAADLDGDGKQDILVSGETVMEVFRNTSTAGALSFGAMQTFTGNEIDGGNIVIADMDGDGRVDLVSAGDNNGGNHFSVQQNTSTPGAISFSPKIDFPATSDQFGVVVAAGQLDGDGKPDLVLITTIQGVGSQVINLFRNTSANGTISFSSGAGYGLQLTSPYANYPVIGDLDGDGKPDICVSNTASNAVSVYRNQIGESTMSVCALSDTNIVAASGGTVYQWQVNNGSGFSNLMDNANYSGTTSSTLQLMAIPNSFSSYQYQCVVDGIAGTIVNLVIRPDTLAGGIASSPVQVCADSLFNVVFTAAGSVPVNSMIELWTSENNSPFIKSFTQIYSGSPTSFPIQDSAGMQVSYFFNIIPPADAASCIIGSNSDTSSTTIIQLTKPIINLDGNVLVLVNPDAAVNYTWEMLGSAGDWVSIVPQSNTSDSLAVSGSYRVQGENSICSSVSDTLIYTKPIVTSAPSDSIEVRFYPNPAFSTLVVDSLDLSAGWITLELINATSGQKISITSIENQTTVILSVGNLENGLYLAVLRRKAGKPAVIKFVKL